MEIQISKEWMYEETKKLLSSLFLLPEVEQIIIKESIISSIRDELAIKRGIDRCFHDIYSDVDIQIKVNLNSREYDEINFIYGDYLKRLGLDKEILGVSYHLTEERGEVIRLCKMNGMRFDLIIMGQKGKEMPLLPHDEVDEVKKKINEFWFIAIQALVKLMRRDYLIASHLSHMLIQEGLVIQMIQRDIDKNTTFHRYGEAEELDYLDIFKRIDNELVNSEDEHYNHIAKLLYSGVKSYDRLIGNRYPIDHSPIEVFFKIWKYYLANNSLNS